MKVILPAEEQPGPPPDEDEAPPTIPLTSTSPDKTQVTDVDPLADAPPLPDLAKPRPPKAAGKDIVAVPCRALLSRLPDFLRGPNWQAGRYPDQYIRLNREQVIAQLREGRVQVNLDDIRADLPPGWVTEEANAHIELDLSDVISALDEPRAEADSKPAPEPEPEPTAEAKPAPEPEPEPTAEAKPTPEPESAPVEENEDTIDLPAAAALRNVPATARGPAWDDDHYPTTAFAVDADELLSQLAKGRVVLSSAALREILPDGWIQADVNIDIDIDLAEVVAAIPPERMQAAGQEDEDVIAARSLGDLFTPQQAPPSAPPPEPTTAPQPVAAAPEAPARTEPVAAPALSPQLQPSTPAPEATGAPQPPESPPAKPQPPAEESPVPADRIVVPAAALLSQLPEDFRGPAYDANALPASTLVVPRDELLAQLVTGRVTVDLAQVADQLPEGWLASDAAGKVPLDLAQVVAAVPPELLKTEAQLAEDVQAAASLPQFFKPQGEIPKTIRKTEEQKPAEPPPATEPPSPKTETTPAAPPAAATVVPSADGETGTTAETMVPPVPKPKPAPRKTPTPPKESRRRAPKLPEWDGVESSLEMAPKGVDINLAKVEELVRLPGIGEVRARQIIQYRKENGPFRSIYDLLNLPGIGRSLFRRMTGLSSTNRYDRHAVLNGLLELNESGLPLLSRVASAMTEQVRAAGCVITNREGIPLAVCGEIPEANRYAALGSRFFSRTQRHLQKFVGRDSDCMIIPGTKPPLLLLSGGELVIILPLHSTVVTSKRLSRVRKATREIAWLVEPRAVVFRY